MIKLTKIPEYFTKSLKDKFTSAETPEICKYCGMIDCQCEDELEKEIVEIKIIDGISFKSNLTKNKIKEYLKNKMSVEDLGDCLFVKKIGKYATFKIEFTSGNPNADIVYVSQIKDDKNNIIDRELFY